LGQRAGVVGLGFREALARNLHIEVLRAREPESRREIYGVNGLAWLRVGD
jgi:hypothetical protein